MKILIVDDDNKNLYLLEILLKSEGYEVVTATNGIEALEKLRASLFEGIISDILMPVMDGFRLIRECKEDPSLRQIPFIFYTATYTEKKDEEFGLSLGAIRYIIKPTEPDDLLMQIRDAFLDYKRLFIDYTMQPVPDEETFNREYTRRIGAKLNKKAQQLTDTEEKYRLLYENSMDAILISRPDGSIQVANPAACVMFQRTQEELLTGGRALIVDTTDPRLSAALEKRTRTGRFKGELMFIRKDGTRFSAEVSSTIFKDNSGQIRTSMIIRDITSRKQAEEELKNLYADLESRVKERTHELSEINIILQEEIQQRTYAEKVNVETLSILDAIIESTKDGILVIDTAGSITKWNNQFITMWNIPESIEIQEKFSLFEYISGYVKNHEPFVSRFQGVYTNLSMEDADVIELNDGRIFEWYSKPQRIRGDIVGRVFSFQDVTSRVRMEIQIEKSLKEKETLLKEIHHRVKNNMQVVSSLLFMQARKTNDAEVKGILLESQNRIKSIALVHERMYQSEDLEQIDYNDYIRKITRHLFESYLVDPTHISLSIGSEIVYLPIDKAVPCSLVINELVTNAVKYAFPQGRKGSICIDFQRQKDRYVLVFRDDGIGMPQGLDKTHSDTIGLELIRGLVRQLNGTIELDRTAGAAYTITFPV